MSTTPSDSTCPTCGGTGGVDSGGETPWGSGIDIPCPSCSIVTPTPSEADKRAAESIYKAEWGTKEAIWPGVPEVAQLIAEAMQPEREALRLSKPFVEPMIQILKNVHDDETLQSAKKALAAIEKVSG